MLADISSGLSSLKAASDIIKGLNATNTLVAINEVKISLQERVIEAREALANAQDAQSAALKRISELEQEIVQLKDWEADKQRYELKHLRRGFYAYILRAGMEAGEPPHGLCTNGYQKRHKAMLQTNGRVSVHEHAWVCHNCKSQFPSQWRDFESLIAQVREEKCGE